ncbi:MAG: Ig-like domain-containing protein, partial [Bacteroidales bacterium]
MKEFYNNAVRRHSASFRFAFLLSAMMLIGMVQAIAQGTITTDPPDPIYLTDSGGSQTITVTTSNGQPWTVTKIYGGTWISPSTSSGNSGDPFIVTYSENATTSTRSAFYEFSATGCDLLPINIQQDKEGIAPIIQKISSTHSSGSFKSGEVIDVDVLYYDLNTISVTGTNLSTNFYLNLNNTAKAYYNSSTAYDAGTHTRKVTFRYTVGSSAGEDIDLLNVNTISLSGNVAVKDAAGNNADQSSPAGNNLANNNTLRIDNTIPTISSITSNATSTGYLKIGNTITFTLSFTGGNKEPLATVNGGYNGHTLSWSTADNGETYTATYTVIAGDADHKTTALQITGVQVTDAAGTTGAAKDGDDIRKLIDANKPTGLFDPSGGTGIDVEVHPTLTFNEAVFALNGLALSPADFQTKITFQRNGTDIPFTASIDGANMVITIVPGMNLLGNSDYTISMASGLVQDIGENNNDLVSTTFTTSATNITNTTRNASYNTIQSAFDEAYNDDNIRLSSGTYTESPNLATANITLEPVNPVSLGNLTISGDHTLTLAGNLTLTGELNLSGVNDKLAISNKTLTLSGTIAGSGYLFGLSSSILTVTGTGVFGSMNLEGELNTLTLNRTSGGTAALGNLPVVFTINTLSLQNGTLELAFNNIKISNYSRINGDILADDMAGIELTGSTNGALVFSGADPKILGTLTLTTSGSVDLASAMTIVSATITSGTLTNSQDVEFTYIYNSATMDMNANVAVNGLFSFDNAAAVVNVSGNTLTFNGDITNYDDTYINAGATSSLVFNGSNAFNLPANIFDLKNLTINRTPGVTLTNDLDVKDLLTLTTGEFKLDAYKLTINKAIAEVRSNLKTISTSSLAIAGTGTGILIPAVGNLKNLIINNSNGATVEGAISIFNRLTLSSGAVSGSDNLTLNYSGSLPTVIPVIERSGGSLDAEPAFFGFVDIFYTGTSAIATGYELPTSSATTNVTVDNGGAGVTLSGNRTINNLALTSGGFDFSGVALTLTGDLSGSGSFTGDGLSDLVLNGTNAFTLPGTASTLQNLVVNRTNGASLGGDLVLEQALTLTTGSFDLANSRLTLKNPIQGTLANLAAGAGSSITIAGSASGIIVPSNITTLGNLTLNNSAGTTLQSNLGLTSLTLTSGKIILGTRSLTTSAISGGSATSYVVADNSGKLNYTGVTTAVKLPVGHALGYTPITVTNSTSANYGVSLKYITGMGAFASPVPSPNFVKMQWDITNSAPDNASVKFEWNLGENFDAAPTLPVVGRFDGSEWVAAGTTGSLGDKTITATGINAFSSFAIYGDLLNRVYVNSVTGSNTNTGENASASDGTGPKATITAGKTVVKEAGTVVIAAGTTYAESVSISKNLTFESTGSFNIVNNLVVTGGKTITLDGNMTVGGALTLTDVADKIDLHGKNLTVNGVLGGDGVLVGDAASNLTLGGSGSVANLNIESNVLNNLTINRHQTVTLAGNLTLKGNLTLTNSDDQLAMASTTLTLEKEIIGDGSLAGTASSNLSIAGSGTFGTMNILGSLNDLILNRAGTTITLGTCTDPLFEINNLTLTEGILQLGSPSATANNLSILTSYNRTNGTFQDDDGLSTLTFNGSTTGTLLFSGLPAVGGITVNSTGTFDIASAMDVYSLNVNSGTLTTSKIVTFGEVTNFGVITLGADASVGGLYASASDDAVLNVGAHEFTFNGSITQTDNTYINAGATSTLVFNGTDAYDLPTGIAELDNLTINRSGGVNMTRNLEVKGTLTLTDGEFAIGENHGLTINNPMSINLPGTLSGTATSSLSVLGATAGDLPSLSLGTLTMDNTSTTTLQGSVTIFNTLQLKRGILGNSVANNITVKDGKSIDISGGRLNAEPIYETSVNILYSGSSPIDTRYELLGGTPSADINVTVNNNGQGVTLTGNRVINNLVLTSGKLTIGSNNLTAGSASGSASNYVVVDGDGLFTLTDVLAGSSFPIGYTGGYTPMSVSNSVPADFSVNLKQVSSLGGFIYPVPSPDFIKLQWNINRSTGGTSAITFNWNAGSNFSGSPAQPVLARFDGTDWVKAGDASFGANTVTVTGITNFSKFAAFGDSLSVVYVASDGSNTNTGETSDNLPAGTGPKQTINQGFKVVKNLGTVNVAAGTFNENVAVNKVVTISGAGLTTVVNGSSASGVFTVGKPGVTLENMTIDNSTALYAIAVNSGVKDLLVQNSKIINNGQKGIYFDTPGTNNVIVNNIFEGTSVDEAIFNSGTTNVIALRNYWDSDKGPKVETNPCGDGKVITAYVTYNPWKNSTFANDVYRLEAFNVTGTTSVCNGESAVITLSGTQNIELGTHYRYTLYKNVTSLIESKFGTGSSISWTVYPNTGDSYTIIAENLLNGCDLAMNGSAVITVYDVLTAGTAGADQVICYGEIP